MKLKKTYRKVDVRKIGLVLLLVLYLVALCVATAKGVNAWTPRQVQAHEIAEIARSMRLPENDPIIVRARELWWEDQPVTFITDWPPDKLAEK